MSAASCFNIRWAGYRIGRRKVIIVSCIGGAAISFFAMTFTGEGLMGFIVVATVGGMSMPLYSLCGAHTNDYLSPTQMVAASGTLVLVNATGATLGAPITAFTMDMIGPHAFYGSIGVMLSLVAAFAIWCSTQRAAIGAEDQGDFVVMTASPMSVSLTQDVELDDIETAADFNAEEVQTSFEELVEELENPLVQESSEKFSVNE